MLSVAKTLKAIGSLFSPLATNGSLRRRKANSQTKTPLRIETLETRAMFTTAILDGPWFDPNTWDNGVPDENSRAIVGHGVTVELDGADHVAGELVVHGQLVATEGSAATEGGDPTVVEDGRMQLYFNGELTGVAAASQLWNHGGGVGIGGVYGTTQTHRGLLRSRHSHYGGEIDKVATHNSALSAAEIDALFAADRQLDTGVPVDDIASLWMFNQGETSAVDHAIGDQTADDGRFVRNASAQGALQLSGDRDYVRIDESDDLNLGVFTEKTISLWFKVDATDGRQMLYEQGGRYRGLNIYLDGDTLYAGAWNSPSWESGWRGDWITKTGIAPGEWNHVALTLDSSSAGAPGNLDKSLTTRWIHVNSGGELLVGSAEDRFDEGTFTIHLTGDDKHADHVIEMNPGGANPGSIQVNANDGFLMTGMNGRIQLYGEDKLSFTKLAETAAVGATAITVENVIERNYSQGETLNGEFVTSAADDGVVNWEQGDQIVIASSSYDYTEEDVRTIESIIDNGDGTSTLTLNAPLEFRHYGETETYGETAAAGTTPAAQSYAIDMRAEVALLSRNIKIQGLASQDTDMAFGDRGNLQVEERIRAAGVSDHEPLSPTQAANGVGGHVMIMPNSGQIIVDGVQLDGLGQASQKGRYPIHWHLGDDRQGDLLRNTSITNSNNRGVTLHGTSNVRIEGVVLHDIHGHGFFFEDAVEMNNELVGNIALGIHKVGGNIFAFAKPGIEDPFVVDTHDNVLETDARFKSSAAFWVTNPTNTFVGNIAAGGAGTGFWYAIPRTVLGDSANKEIYDHIVPIFAEFGQFDNNTSHSTPVGLNFDRGTDIEDGNFDNELRTTDAANNYTPRSDVNDPSSATTHYVNDFTNYKATDAAVYHRGQAETIFYNGLRIADSANAAWAVSETGFNDSLYVGHSRGNADYDSVVAGPRLYDGSGLHSGAHFAGFSHENAYAFQSEASSFGPTMYHAFQDVSFEADGTYGHLAHAGAGSDPTSHDLGSPHQWAKAALDLDGTLTSGVGGGKGHTIVPDVDFLVDGNDFQPAGWNAWVTEDVYARVRIENNDDGERLFPSEAEAPLVRFTARDGDQIDAMAGQNNGDLSWVQVQAKADGDGFVEGDFTIEFMSNGVPRNGFVFNMKNQDGGRPALDADIQQKVENARIVLKIIAAGNYTPDLGIEVDTEEALRSVQTGLAYYRDDMGNLYLNSGIEDSQPHFSLAPGVPLQTAFVDRTIQYGTVVEAEAFDIGIDGVAYHDSDDINTLGDFRHDTAVDADSTQVGDIADGEWLEYTGDIVAAAYRVGFKIAATEAGGQIRLLAANSNSAGFLAELGVVDVPDTGGEWSTVWLDGVDLASVAGAGSVVRMEFVGGGFQVDSLQFAASNQSPFVERTISADTTTRIELEEFDLGGQGVAYHDTTPGNTAGDFRADEDVETNGSLLTNEVFDGEWLEYTTDIEAGLYNVTLHKTWGGNTGVKLFVGESSASTEFTELGMFDFTTGDGELITLENIDLSPWAGAARVFRIEIVGNWMGLDYLDFAPFV